MRHLELNPPLLIMVMGYPGAGKSFFARQFSEQYGVARVSEDRIRFELFANPRFDSEENEIIMSMMHYMLEQLMQTDSPIICDASFLKAKERKAYADLATKNGYRTLTIWIQTDAETAQARARKRDRRNPDSKYSFDLTPETFLNLKSQLQRPTEKELSVVISGKHAFKGQCLSVLRKIASVYSESLTKELGSSTTPQRRTQIRPNQRFIQ